MWANLMAALTLPAGYAPASVRFFAYPAAR